MEMIIPTFSLFSLNWHCPQYQFEYVAPQMSNLTCTFIEALEDSGIPFSYFPVMIPQAKGDQETTPTPARSQSQLSNKQIRQIWYSEKFP